MSGERVGAVSESRRIERLVGHPGDRWDVLQARIQNESLKSFNSILPDWLDLMWSLDRYIVAGVPPRGMGNPEHTDRKRLEAVNKGKGQWFATAIALLLENWTSHRLAPRARVQGFSQLHQIDVAWPVRQVDPLVCLETKVTGNPSRGPLNDWSNRRKELKFAATDLKLFRRQQFTTIDHWDVWRESEFPRCYFIWAARLKRRLGEDAEGEPSSRADLPRRCRRGRLGRERRPLRVNGRAPGGPRFCH